jgi:hypothetical protein
MLKDERLYKNGTEHGYWLAKESPATFDKMTKDLKEQSAPMSYRDGLNEGKKLAEKEKFMEQWNKKGKDQEPER